MGIRLSDLQHAGERYRRFLQAQTHAPAQAVAALMGRGPALEGG